MSSFYTQVPMEYAPGQVGYSIKPYTPKPYGGPGFSEQLGAAGSGNSAANPAATLASLTQSQLEALREKLKQGREEMTPEEWDDFLIALVDAGLIKDQDRHNAFGTAIALGNVPLNGSMVSYEPGGTGSNGMQDLYDQWNGDPLHYLDALEVYLLKQRACLEMNGYDGSAPMHQQASCAKISTLVRNLLAG